MTTITNAIMDTIANKFNAIFASEQPTEDTCFAIEETLHQARVNNEDNGGFEEPEEQEQVQEQKTKSISEDQYQDLATSDDVEDIEHFGCDITGTYSFIAVWYADGTNEFMEIDHSIKNESDDRFYKALVQYTEDQDNLELVEQSPVIEEQSTTFDRVAHYNSDRENTCKLTHICNTCNHQEYCFYGEFRYEQN